MAIVDQSACRLEQDSAHAVIFRKISVVGTITYLEIPETDSQEGHDQQQSKPKNGESPLNFP